MNKILVIGLLVGFAGAASAGEGQQGQPQQQGQQQGQQQQAVAGASNAGNTQAITFTTPANTTSSVSENITGNSSVSETIKNTPSVNGPNLTTSNDTCMGSTSGSINVAGFGFGAGSSWTDKNCVLLKNSRELWNMGMKAAALARMCMDQDNKDALEMTGFECPTKKANSSSKK